MSEIVDALENDLEHAGRNAIARLDVVLGAYAGALKAAEERNKRQATEAAALSKLVDDMRGDSCPDGQFVRHTVAGRVTWAHPQGRGQAKIAESIGVSVYRELLSRGERAYVRIHLPAGDPLLITCNQARRLVKHLEERIAQAERWG